MKKRSINKIETLPGETIVEVVAVGPDKDPVKKEMTLNDAKGLKRKKGWKYWTFQRGYSQYLNIKK